MKQLMVTENPITLEGSRVDVDVQRRKSSILTDDTEFTLRMQSEDDGCRNLTDDNNGDKTDTSESSFLRDRFFESMTDTIITTRAPDQEVPILRRNDIKRSYVKPVTANPKIALLFINDEYKTIIPTLYGRLYDDKRLLEQSVFTRRFVSWFPRLASKQHVKTIQLIEHLMDMIDHAYHQEDGVNMFRDDVLRVIKSMPEDAMPDVEDYWKNVSASEIVSNLVELNIHWHFLDEQNVLYRSVSHTYCIRPVATIKNPIYCVVCMIIRYHHVDYGQNEYRLVTIWDFLRYRMKIYALGVINDQENDLTCNEMNNEA
jgi:hypothetical protein